MSKNKTFKYTDKDTNKTLLYEYAKKVTQITMPDTNSCVNINIKNNCLCRLLLKDLELTIPFDKNDRFFVEFYNCEMKL